MPSCADPAWMAGVRRCSASHLDEVFRLHGPGWKQLDVLDRGAMAGEYAQAWLEHHAHAFDGRAHALQERLALLTVPLRWGWRLYPHGGWHDAWQQWGVVEHRHPTSTVVQGLQAQIRLWHRWHAPSLATPETRRDTYLAHLAGGDIVGSAQVRALGAVALPDPQAWAAAWLDALGRVWGEGWVSPDCTVVEQELSWWLQHVPQAPDYITGYRPGLLQAQTYLLRQLLEADVHEGHGKATRGRL